MKWAAALGLCVAAAAAHADPAPTAPGPAPEAAPDAVPASELEDAPTSEVPSDTTPATSAVFAGAPYTAETYPVERVRRPLSLVPGMMEVDSSFGIGLSKGVAGNQLSLGLGVTYGILPLLDIGLFVETLDIRSFTSQLQAGGFLRRQILDFASLRGDLELLRPPDGTARVTGRVGIPFRLRYGPFALEGFDHVASVQMATQAVELTLPFSVIAQLGRLTFLDLHAAPDWPALAHPHLVLPLSAAIGLAFSNTSELAITFRMLDVRAGEDSRDLMISLLLRM